MKRVCAMPNEQLPRFGEAAQDGSRGSSKTSSNERERELFERFEHALFEYDAVADQAQGPSFCSRLENYRGLSLRST